MLRSGVNVNTTDATTGALRVGKERCLPVLNSTGVDRGLLLPPDLTAVPIVNLHMYNVFAAEGVNEKPRSGITAWPKFAARDRSASLCFVW